MKSTIYSYMSNIKRGGNSSIQGASTLIAREFERGKISYFRTDGFYHAPLQVLKENGCDKMVLQSILNEPKYDIEFMDDSYYVSADKYLQPYFLNIASPYEYLYHGAKFVDSFKKSNKKPSDFPPPENMYIGLEQRLQERELLRRRHEISDFSFTDFLQKCSATIKMKENNIPDEEIDRYKRQVRVKYDQNQISL